MLRFSLERGIFMRERTKWAFGWGKTANEPAQQGPVLIGRILPGAMSAIATTGIS